MDLLLIMINRPLVLSCFALRESFKGIIPHIDSYCTQILLA